MRFVALKLLALLSLTATADEIDVAGDVTLSTPIVVGTRYCDLDGVVHRLGLDSASKSTTVVFLDPGCEVCDKVVPLLNALHRDADSRGTSVDGGTRLFGVVSNPAVTLARARESRDQLGIEFPMLWDSTGALADRLRPLHTPEAFVFSNLDRLVYRGRVVGPDPPAHASDSNTTDPNTTDPNTTDPNTSDPSPSDPDLRDVTLRDVITDVAQGSMPRVEVADAFGSKFDAWGDYSIDPAELNFHRHIAPILNANCADCHRQGGAGRYALNNYRSATRGAVMLAYVCSDRRMPPWSAEPGFGRFREERLLSSREIALLSAWTQSPKQQGSPSDRLPPPSLLRVKKTSEPDRPSFTIGTRDLQIPAGTDKYTRRVSMKVPADLQVVAVTPRMRHLGASVKVTVTTPSGDVLPIINITDWDYRWRTTYTMLQPLPIPSGSRVDARFEWNNAWSNPNNEKAGKETVTSGPSASDEMAEIEFRYSVDPTIDVDPIIDAANASWDTRQDS